MKNLNINLSFNFRWWIGLSLVLFITFWLVPFTGKYQDQPAAVILLAFITREYICPTSEILEVAPI